MPALQQLALDERMIPTGRREPFSEREFTLAETSWDDGFELEAQPGRFAVTGAAHGISVELLTGFPYAQIYAPLGHDYVCFEPMTAPTNALQSGDGLSYVAPGEQYSASFRVRTWRD